MKPLASTVSLPLMKIILDVRGLWKGRFQLQDWLETFGRRLAA